MDDRLKQQALAHGLVKTPITEVAHAMSFGDFTAWIVRTDEGLHFLSVDANNQVYQPTPNAVSRVLDRAKERVDELATALQIAKAD